QDGAQGPRVLGAQGALEDLDERRVRRGPFRLVTAAHEEPNAVTGPRPQLRNEPALAHTRFPGERHQGPPARSGVLEPARERGHLRRSACQWGPPPQTAVR